MKYKLICFDLDGTIIDETIFIWDTIHDFCGVPKEVRRKAYDDFITKKITYDEWYAGDRRELRKVGCTKEKLFEAIKPLKLVPGALETLKELKDKGLKIAIISGSLDIALQYLIPNYKEIFDDIKNRERYQVVSYESHNIFILKMSMYGEFLSKHKLDGKIVLSK